MKGTLSPDTTDEVIITSRTVWKAVTRPYRVTIPMILLVALVPFYLVIAALARSNSPAVPELAFERHVPVVPSWAIVYGALYAFLIILPVIVIHETELIRRSVWAYLTVWLVSYACFLVYPTVASRPDTVQGDGFAEWGLRFLYDADPPYNCFPSLHVAHSFVSALATYRVHCRLGIVAITCAVLVATSTIFTKQHYIADVLAGALLAYVAYTLLLRPYSRGNIQELHRRLAPILALGVAGIVGLALACMWVIYQFGGLG